jgi:predicted dehydrogenase
LPASVRASGLAETGKYKEDNIHLVLEFRDGSLGTVDYLANGSKTFPKERLEVFTGGKVAMLDDFRTLELINDEKKKVYRSRMRQDKGHQAEWQVFQEAIIGGGKPPIPYDQIYAVSLSSIASVEALRSGKSVAIPQRPGS